MKANSPVAIPAPTDEDKPFQVGESDPFEQPYWNLDQYLIWLASRDPAAVLNATDRPNSRTNQPIGWREYLGSNVDRQKVEMEAVRAIRCGDIKACCVKFNGEWFTPDDPEWFTDCVIEFEGEPTFAALLVRTTEHGRREKVSPRFNPQSIARLYPAPTPSNIRDTPDVENPDIGPFIAYFDAWYWLAEHISLRESLPIDEAGSRAEKTIRYICMTTPEKLTMWGFHKGDPDAELKPVTPQAWQGLWINPLPGQPETDLKALGRRREYGAATKGEYGPVIWTGLCFKRKQFVAAFGTVPGQDAASDEERQVINHAASILKENRNAKRDDVRSNCQDRFSGLSKRRFDRLWPEARAEAGLSRRAPSGPKPNAGYPRKFPSLLPRAIRRT